jgi:predicted transcriptional regulator
MAIFRKVKKTDYTVIDNNIFKNKKLSLKGKGMICTMLSLPDNWQFTEEGLAELSNDSRTGIRTTLNELMELGYLTRKQLKDTSGKFTNMEYTIYEEPLYQKPTSVKPTSENVHNKVLNNKVLNNKKEIYKERPTLEEIKDYCLNVRHNKVDYKKFYDYFTEGNWIDSKGNKVKNWKQKVITWEKNTNDKKEFEYERL